MILCPKCFTANEDNAKFCCKCGDPLDQRVEEEIAEETTILEPQIDFGSNSGRIHSNSSASLQMSGSLSGASATNASPTGGSLPDAGAENGNGNQSAASKTGIIALAIAAVSVILAIVCLAMLLTTPKAPEVTDQPNESESSGQSDESGNADQPAVTEVVNQPGRIDNIKTDALFVDANDRNAACNLPGCVVVEDAAKGKNLPPVIKEGRFYALWDCDVLNINGEGKAHILVTLREEVPVPGRVWVNWYNWDKWTGWKAFTPS